MESRVDVKKILEAMKEKLEAMVSPLDNMANEFKAIKESKEIVKREVINEEDDKTKAQQLLQLSRENVIKKVVIDEEDNKIEVGFEILSAFLVVYDIEFREIRVARLGFETYTTMLRINDVIVVFTTMVNNKGLTFVSSRDN